MDQAGAIENAPLPGKGRYQAEEMALLFDISAALASAQDLNHVLQTATCCLTATLAADGCTISLWDQEQDALVTQLDYSAGSDRECEEPGTLYPLNEYPLSRQVLLDRQPVVIQAGDGQADSGERKWMAGRGVISLLLVPLIVQDKVVGILRLRQCDEQRDFTPAELRLCQILANQAAATLETTRLSPNVQEVNQAKSEFIDFVAHELKQPMTAMQGYAKMLTMGIGGPLTETQHEFVRVINANVDRMSKLVNDLLEISRLEAGRTRLTLASVPLQEVVEEAIANGCTEIDARQHRLIVDIPNDLPPVLGDRERLVQIVTNLLSNAYRYTPNGGTIQISLTELEGAGGAPASVQVSVCDSGIGMSPQELLRLGEKFFRADHDLVRAQPGTGLGVCISRHLVALHGGQLEVESEVGRGSTFRFTIPVAKQTE